MIRLREYLADPEVFLDPAVVRLRAHLRVFFQVLFFATDGAGRFRADAASLRAVLYTAAAQHVSTQDVQAWLVDLHQRGLIRLYTENGTALGKVTEKFWRQRDSRRKVIHPDESTDPPAAELFTIPGGPHPPPVQSSELNRRETAPAKPAKSEKEELFTALAQACGLVPAELGPRAARTVAIALADIRAATPGVTPEEIHARAAGYRAFMPASCRITPTALAKHWAACGSEDRGQRAEDSPPPNWREILEALHPGNTINAEQRGWTTVPEQIRAAVLDRARQGRAA